MDRDFFAAFSILNSAFPQIDTGGFEVWLFEAGVLTELVPPLRGRNISRVEANARNLVGGFSLLVSPQIERSAGLRIDRLDRRGVGRAQSANIAHWGLAEEAAKINVEGARYPERLEKMTGL
jgi:hypothetical protein